MVPQNHEQKRACLKKRHSTTGYYVLVPKKPKNHPESNQISKLDEKETGKWVVEEEDLEEEGEVQGRVLVDQQIVDAQNADTQLHMPVEHPAPVWPAPSVAQD